LLEVNRSALTTPSRIESIAGSTMKMTEAKAVSYMRLPEADGDVASATGAEVVQASRVVSAANSRDSGGISDLLSSVMHMAAGEAQIMLVGDVGLASAK
jgi:hypothetical protein